MWVAVIIIGAILLLLCYQLSSNDSAVSAIPCPPTTLLFGNALQIDKKRPFLTLDKFARKYGSILRLKIFRQNVIVVNDFERIYDVLVKRSSDFDGRSNTFRFHYVSEQSDIALTDPGKAHTERRKFVQGFLKQFGTGIERIEEVTRTATDELITKLRDENGRQINIYELFFECLIDLVAILITGDTINKQDTKAIMNGVHILMHALGNDADGQMLDMFPFLRYFGNRSFKSILTFDKLKEKYIADWLARKPENGFINKLISMTDDEQKACYLYEEKAKMNMILQFFVAGTYTTSTTLTCLVNALCHNPSIQKNLQKEVSDHIGHSRLPKLTDRDNMPYHNATLLEIGRFASIFPVAIPHSTTRDTHIDQYSIPKDTEVWVNLWTMHHDEKFWDEPFQFRPERFIDEDGNLLAVDHANRKHTMPFGAGHRVCVGEIFAQRRLFMFLSRLMQEFTILPAATIEEQPSCDPRKMEVGMISTPLPFKVRFQELNHNV